MLAVFPDNVPLYEEHGVRIAASYTLPEWYRLDPMERALEVAHYRCRRLVDAMSQEKASKGK
jgi:hypothetical protein